jgi:phage terminase large subunit
VGQPLAAHVNWMRSRGYTEDRAHIWLPHDGVKHDFVHDVTYESSLKQLGYTVNVIPNQGAGAALMRVNAGRRLFPQMWFNEETTKGGVEALGWYHEKIDEERGIGLGPNHDWSSNAADAFGLACVAYELPSERPSEIKMDVSWVT